MEIEASEKRNLGLLNCMSLAATTANPDELLSIFSWRGWAAELRDCSFSLILVSSLDHISTSADII